MNTYAILRYCTGTTLIAAQKTGRRCAAIEIDPLYCDVIIRRARDLCGLEAVLEGTDQSFAVIERERAACATEMEAQHG